MSVSFRKKLCIVAVITFVVMVLAALMAKLTGAPVENGLVGGAIVGFAIATFEEFYFQQRHGQWMRLMHPLASILIYSFVILLIFFFAQHALHLVLGRLDELPKAYERLSHTLPIAFCVALVAVLSLRAIGFIGAGTLLDLFIGRYHRPVLERKVFLFLDMKGSTEMVERLGAVKGKALLSKFLFDLSNPITDHLGDIYLYAGDGLIAMWNWDDAIQDNNIGGAVDAIYAMMERERNTYETEFDCVPEFRIGIHGGEVVISEQGDAKRSIGVYGETINIAARLEQAAKTLGHDCVLSSDIVEALDNSEARFHFIGSESVRGVSKPVEVFAFRKK
jgi:class 3 adenylate cyclase